MSDERPLVAVFDIDGVLADVRHRLHHLERRPKDWSAFFAAMSADTPLADGVMLAREHAEAGHAVAYLTGRAEPYRRVTQTWLDRHELPAGPLLMRAAHDRRPARLLKPSLLRRLAEAGEVVLVVDDDAAVVDVLRRAGWPVRLADWMPATAPAQGMLFDAQESDGRT